MVHARKKHGTYRASYKEHSKEGHGEMGTGKKGSTKNLEKSAQKEKKMFSFVNYFYYYLMNI